MLETIETIKSKLENKEFNCTVGAEVFLNSNSDYMEEEELLQFLDENGFGYYKEISNECWYVFETKKDLEIFLKYDRSANPDYSNAYDNHYGY